MIWHIFKKDWKLLWRYAVVVWTVQLIFGWMQFAMDSSESRMLERMMDTLGALPLLASAFLLSAAVHQDAIPALRQDWLVRPVRPGDLLAAKLLFAFITVNGPILLGDVFQGLAHGFSFSLVVGPAISRGIFLIIGFTLPVLVLAALTRTTMEAAIGATGFFICVSGFQQLLLSRSPNALQLRWSGVSWVPASLVLVIAIFGAGAILWGQYSMRKTLFSRWLAASVVVLCLLTQFMPWGTAFAIQERLSPSRVTPSPILISFDPTLGKFRHPSGINDEELDRRRRLFNDESPVTVYLPLSIEGLPGNAVLNIDRSEIRMIDANGKTVDLGLGDPLVVHEDAPGSETPIHHAMKVRRDLYDRIKDQPIRLEIDYSSTLLRLGGSDVIPAVGADKKLALLGRCTTRVDDSETLVEVHCFNPGNLPSCVTVLLEHAPSGRRNPESTFCQPEYAPYFGFGQYGLDALSRSGVTLRFRYSDGSVQYPVSGQQLEQSQVRFKVYQPQDHFTTRLVIPQITLREWEAQ